MSCDLIDQLSKAAQSIAMVMIAITVAASLPLEEASASITGASITGSAMPPAMAGDVAATIARIATIVFIVSPTIK